MTIAIRSMVIEDIDAVVAAGHSDRAFAVSQRIRFYEQTELEEWIGDPNENVLLVADAEGTVSGFLFCKIMSHHWAMLDNFYVLPSFRSRGTGRALMEGLIERLRCRNVSYLQTLSAADEPAIAEYLRRFGFQTSKTYEWNELFLDQSCADREPSIVPRR